MLLLCGLLAGVGRGSHAPRRPAVSSTSDEVRVEYDGQADRTVVMLELAPFGDSGMICRGDWRMITEFSYTGRKPQPPDNVALGFFTPPDEELIGREVSAVVDGEQVRLGKMTLNHNDFRQWPGCRNLYDTFGLHVPRATFRRIVKAKTVEVHVGEKALHLTAAHLDALSKFAKQMEQ
jgi:hypothetical protein